MVTAERIDRIVGFKGDGLPVVSLTPDVIDELVQAVIDEGGSIKHVEASTKLADYTVAAHLRFPLPPA